LDFSSCSEGVRISCHTDPEIRYGTENKDCPIRAIANRMGYWELRFADATANLYLFLAAVITAGCLGIREKMDLPVKDATDDLLANFTDMDFKEHNITTLLPTTLTQALDALESGMKDKKMAEWLGQDFLEKYLKTKRAEDEWLGGLSEGERKKEGTLRW